MTGETKARARRRRLGALPVLALVGLGLAPAALEAAEDAGRVRSEVSAALAEYAEAINVGDWERVVEFYSADPEFLWIEDGVVRYRSRAEVAQAFAGLGSVFAALELRFDEVHVVPLSDGVASAGMLFHQAMTTAAGTRLEIEGAILATLVKRDGAWRFVSGHTSSRQPQGDS